MDQNKMYRDILAIVVGFLVIYLFTKWEVLLYILTVTGILALSSEYLATKIAWAWTKLTLILSRIMPTILLTIIFYVLLTPLALLSRLLGDGNSLKLKNRSESFFRDRNSRFTKDSFHNIW